MNFTIFGFSISALNIIEFFGVITSLIYLYYSIKINKLLLLFGLISAVLYTIVFFYSKIYAGGFLQLYYVFISIYGWILWQKSLNNQVEFPISQVGVKQGFILAFITFALFVPIAYVLKNHSDSNVPYFDAILTAASIVATWMLARKILQHWIIWVVVDLASIALYLYQQLYFTAFLFAIYTIFAIKGFVDWKKEMAVLITEDK